MALQRRDGPPIVAVYTDSWVEHVFRKLTAAMSVPVWAAKPLFVDYGPTPLIPERSAAVPPWTGRAQGAIAIVKTGGDPSAFAAWLQRGGVPVVSLNVELLGIGIATACADYMELGSLAAAHLAKDAGCRSFVHLGVSGSAATPLRESGFHAGLAALGCEMHVVRTAAEMVSEVADPPSLVEPEILATLLDLPRPVGVFTMSDDYAVSLARLCGEAGLRVPDDVAILGVGNSMIAHAHHPTLSSIQVSDSGIGRAGMTLLHALMRGERPATQHVLVGGHKLYGRASTVGNREPFGRLAVDMALERIRSHAVGGLTVNRLTKLLRVPERSLRQLFQDELGSTPSAEIQRVKFEHAARLLKCTTLPVGRIAHVVGFGSLAAFSNFFHRMIGMPPLQYRRAGATRRRGQPASARRR